MSDDKRIEGSVELGNALEALMNVLYLIRLDRHSPGRVLQWIEMADGQSKRMESILRRERLSLPPTTQKPNCASTLGTRNEPEIPS